MTSETNCRSLLLELPSEIRTLIYGFLVDPSQTDLCRYNPRSARWRLSRIRAEQQDQVTPLLVRVGVTAVKWRQKSSAVPPIVCVSRLIWTEAITVYYSANCFYFDHCGLDSVVKWILKDFSKLKYLRAIRWTPSIYSRGDITADVLHATVVLLALRTYNTRLNLYLDFPPGESHHLPCLLASRLDEVWEGGTLQELGDEPSFTQLKLLVRQDIAGWWSQYVAQATTASEIDERSAKDEGPDENDACCDSCLSAAFERMCFDRHHGRWLDSAPQ